MYYRFLLICFFLLCASSFVFAQNTPVFPDLIGEELLEALVEHYRPTQVLGYGQARDVLYGEIDNPDDSLRCVYTGYTIYLDPDADPSSYAYEHGINCEHTWPQSKGAEGQARSDMHHLYATRIDANEARGSNPFDDIDDVETDRWWRLNYYQGNIPESHLDEYSEEDRFVRFESREDHKGNVARSMFYFYTMYREQADEADPDFFDVQREVLLDWHSLDPIDDWEVTRTELIASYQSNRSNPFVLDSTLVLRAYFPELVGIDKSPIEITIPSYQPRITNYPNPFNPTTIIQYDLPQAAIIDLTIYNINGYEVEHLYEGRRPAGSYQLEWETNNLPSGLYFFQLEMDNGFQTTHPLILMR